MPRPTFARRKIGVRSGIAESQEEHFQPTTLVEVPDRLEQIFLKLQENVDLKLQKQQELLEERLEQERCRIAEKETEKAAEMETLDKRFGAIELKRLSPSTVKYFKFNPS